MIKIGLIQMRSEKGTVEGNIATMATFIAEAANKKIDILAFPEMNITGYADPTKDSTAMLSLDGAAVAEIQALSRGHNITLLAGLIEANPAGKPFITQVVIRDGRRLGEYRKCTIKDEEVLWFSPGETIPVFTHDNLTYGIAICADIDNEAVFATLGQRGARIIFEVAAPGLYGDQAARDWKASFEWWEEKCGQQLGEYAKKYEVWIVVATQAGRTIDEDFPGGGFVFSPKGRLFATQNGKPGAVYLTLDLENSSLEII